MTYHKLKIKKKQAGFWPPDKSLSVILFLVFLFGVFSVIYTDSNNISQEQQRKLAYGSWHIAAYNTDSETRQLMQSHATVQAAGCMEIYGNVTETAKGNKESLGYIGFADQNALDIGNITLLDGRFPNTQDEIAVEAFSLHRLGLDNTLGQQITVTIIRKDGSDTPKTDIRTYKICGIVQNYSANWKTGGYPLPSFFICNKFYDTENSAMLHVFVQMKPEFAENASSLSMLCSWHSFFTKNDFTYLHHGKETFFTPFFSVWQMILLLSGMIFTLTLTQADVRQRYRSFLILRTLGASRKQIFSFFLWEKARLIGISSSLGIFLGILLAYLFSILPGFPAFPNICSFQAMHLLQIVLWLYIGVIPFSVLSLIPLLHMPLQKTAFKQPMDYHSRIIFYNRKKSRSHTITALFRFTDLKQNLFQTALTFTLSVFVYFLAYRAFYAASAYLQYRNDFPEDYTFGNLSSYTPPHSTITEDELQQIRHTYGVKNIISVSVSKSCQIEFSNSYDTEYADKVRSLLSEKGDIGENTEINGIFVGCADELLAVYKDEVESISLERTPALNEVILYLPDYGIQTEGSLKDFKTDNGMGLLSENTIAVGNVIHMETDNGEKELKIVGIIRSFPDSLPESYRLIRPYSIICSQDTYQEIWNRADYAFVQIFQDNTAIPYQTAIELSHQENGLYFHNKRAERMRLLQELISQTMLALLLCTSVFLAAMSIRLGLYSYYGKQIYERYRILYQLGMSRSDIRRILFRKAFWNSGIGCGTAAGVFWKVYYENAVNLLTIILILGGFVLNWMILFVYDYWYVRKGLSKPGPHSPFI